jgi:hypothetical protein
MSCMLCGSVLIAYVLRGVPASPYMPREAGLQVRSVQGYYSSRTRSSLYKVWKAILALVQVLVPPCLASWRLYIAPAMDNNPSQARDWSGGPRGQPHMGAGGWEGALVFVSFFFSFLFLFIYLLFIHFLLSISFSFSIFIFLFRFISYFLILFIFQFYSFYFLFYFLFLFISLFLIF